MGVEAMESVIRSLHDAIKDLDARLVHCEKRWADHFDELQRLRLFVSEADIGHVNAMVIVDGDGNVREWNEAATRLFQWSQEEALGRHLSFLVPPEFPSSSQPGVQESLRSQNEAGEPQGGHDGVYPELHADCRTDRGPVIMGRIRRLVAGSCGVYAAATLSG